MDGKLRNMTSLYLDNGQALLCLYRLGSRVADKLYIGSAGGHFEPEELNDPKACILRELKEELGLGPEAVPNMRLRYITLRLKNGEVRQNYYFFAPWQDSRELCSTEGILRWVPYGEIPALEMPASAKETVLHYIREGKYTDCLYGGVTREENTAFVKLEEFGI